MCSLRYDWAAGLDTLWADADAYTAYTSYTGYVGFIHFWINQIPLDAGMEATLDKESEG